MTRGPKKAPSTAVAPRASTSIAKAIPASDSETSASPAMPVVGGKNS
jgi:hypothetical protein